MKLRSRKSIHSKLITLIILSSTVPLLCLGLFSVLFINRSTQENLNQRLSEVLRSADELIHASIASQILDLEIMVESLKEAKLFENESFDNHQKAQVLTQFYQYLKSDESVLNMYLVLEGGDYVGTEAIPEIYEYPKNKNWGIYRTILTNRKDNFFPNPTRYSTSFNNAYSIIFSITNHGENLGFLILDVSTEYIQNLLKTVKGTSFGYIQFILSSKYDIVMYNDSNFFNNIAIINNVLSDDANIDDSSVAENTIRKVRNQQYEYDIYGVIPNSMIVDQSRYLSIAIGAIILTTAFFASIIGVRMSKRIVNPVNALMAKMATYHGVKEDKLDSVDGDEISLLDRQFELLMKRIEQYHQSDLEKQDLLRKTEIKTLMSQINPHFINNTLDSIKWKARLNETKDIENIVTSLSALLKGSMNISDAYVKLSEEIQMAVNYIKIQQIRYGNRLDYVLGIQEEVLDIYIPKFILQPIIENSIIHGIEPLERSGMVEINAWLDENYIYLSIADNGVGTSLKYTDIESAGIGLANVKRRIQLHYGKSADVWWKSELNIGTVVFIKLPKRGEHNV